MFAYDNTTEKLQIVDIKWERIFLIISLKNEIDNKLKFGLRSFRRKKIPVDQRDESERVWGNYSPDDEDCPIEHVTIDDDGFTILKINMASANKREFLDNDRWQIVAIDENDTIYHCSVTYDMAHHIDDYCRIFRLGSHSNILTWLKLVTKIAKQDFIFVDDYVPIFGYLNLDKRTKLIQVWHAGVGFKSVGYSRFGKSGSPYPTETCHKKYDYVITGSKELVEVYEEVFGIEEDAFLPIGMARLDDFFDEEKIKAVKENFYKEYPELVNKKIILFAPTFRGAVQKSMRHF